MGFTKLDKLDLRNTILGELAPVADDLRDLATQFGLRTYEVRIVRIKWSGGARGEGVDSVASELVLLPTPKLETLETLEEMVQVVGVDEFGACQLTQISPRYTEAQLLGHHDDGSPPDPDEEVFYEIETAQLTAAPSSTNKKRRFTVKNTPTQYPGRLEWVVQLERARGDRANDGRVDYP